eukprot:XP_001692360.1 predicted protein [Chlamydomonas reinhardtii]
MNLFNLERVKKHLSLSTSSTVKRNMSICLMCFSKLERLLVMMNKEGMQTKYHAFIIQVCIHIKNRISTIFLLHFSADPFTSKATSTTSSHHYFHVFSLSAPPWIASRTQLHAAQCTKGKISKSVKIADSITFLHSYQSSLIDHNNIQTTVNSLFKNIKFTSDHQTAILFSYSTCAFFLPSNLTTHSLQTTPKLGLGIHEINA